MKRLKRLTRKKYRITALFLALCMTLSLLPISALAAGTDLAGKAIEEGTFAATGGNVNYRIDGEEIVITGGDDTVSEIVFPDEIDGKPVTRIMKRTISLTGNLVPAKFLSIVDRFGDNPAAMKQAGIAYATEQIIDLIANGVNHIHIYSMNKPDVAAAIMNNLSQIYVREQA